MKNILIVDDVTAIRKAIHTALRKCESYNLIEATNGLEAMEIIRNNPIDLIIMDLVMPKKGGVEVLMELKANNTIEIIVMTGKVAEDREKFFDLAKKYGAKHVLFKPFRKKELLEAVESSLKPHNLV